MVSSLVDMATRAACRNASGIDDFGDMPLKLAEPILRKVTHPQQLRDIEVNSPHLADGTADVWLHMVQRDIPLWQEKLVEPKNPRSWWKVYRKLIRRELEEKKLSEDALRRSLQALGQQRSQNQTTVIERVLPHARDQGGFSTARSEMKKKSTPTLKNAKTGQEVMSALRRQSALAHREKNLVASNTSTFLTTPRDSIFDEARRGGVPVVRPRVSAKKPDITDMQRTWNMGGQHKTTLKIREAPAALTRNQKEINAIIQREHTVKEDNLRALTGSSTKPSAAGSGTTPVKERLPASESSSQAQGPNAIFPSHTTSIKTIPKDTAASTSSKESSESPDHANTTSIAIRKRPAPGSIFMQSKKKKV